MGPLLAAAAALGAYQFGPGSAHDYRLSLVFDGFLPVFGGNTGEASVGLLMEVRGLEPGEKGQRASGELTEFTFEFNGFPLPLDLESIREYLPKTTISLTPQGRMTATDAPDKPLPVPLPGLDPKRFPDLTYLPIELPEAGLGEPGQKWTFERPFSGGPVTYTCELEAVKGSQARIKVSLRQETTYLENSALEQTTAREQATAEISNVLTGEGAVIFNVDLGCVDSVEVQSLAVGQVKPLDGSEASERRLSTKLKAGRVGAKPWES